DLQFHTHHATLFNALNFKHQTVVLDHFSRLEHVARFRQQEAADSRVSLDSGTDSFRRRLRSRTANPPSSTYVASSICMICSFTSSSCSSEISPTISSSRSSSVMMPSSPPCSSTTNPKCIFAFCIWRSTCSSRAVSTTYNGGCSTSSSLNFSGWSRYGITSLLCIKPQTSSNDSRYTGKRE